jgi:preprotein translocase subunit Sec63
MLPTFGFSILFIGVGICSVYVGACQIQRTPHGLQIWDPLKVLGVTRFTSESQMKRIYKKKSLQLHPDKRRKSKSKEEAEKEFILLTKAYKW